MNQLTVSTPKLTFTRTALLALSTWVLSALLTASNAWSNADAFSTDSYDYGGEAVHLFVAVDQRGPKTLELRRLLSREHRVDTNDYILLAVVVDNLNATDSGFARLSVGGHKGPKVQTADFQTRLLAPADDRRNWNLYLNRDAQITGFTAILAPRASTNYRGSDYGYYDRGYLNNSTFYGWIWRDRYYQHPRGHRFYNNRPYDQHGDRHVTVTTAVNTIVATTVATIVAAIRITAHTGITTDRLRVAISITTVLQHRNKRTSQANDQHVLGLAIATCMITSAPNDRIGTRAHPDTTIATKTKTETEIRTGVCGVTTSIEVNAAPIANVSSRSAKRHALPHQVRSGHVRSSVNNHVRNNVRNNVNNNVRNNVNNRANKNARSAHSPASPVLSDVRS